MNPPAIPALPSLYNGVVFRSRLEARWAHLFDQYGIKWVYEPDAFKVPSGNYLPDFFFPALETYVEVKPGPDMIALEDMESVANQTNKSFLLLDSPIVECRTYPLYTAWNGEKPIWTDTSFCFSAKYLLTRRDFEYRWFIEVGDSHGKIGASSPCISCCGDAWGWKEGDPDFRWSRSLRFNNGIAK